MEYIYKGAFLNIIYEQHNSLFVQQWMVPPVQPQDFKQEMLAYVNLYGQYKPKYTLWDQTNFSMRMDLELMQWVEKHVNEPCKIYGNKKCAFIVGKNVLAHVDVIQSFDDMNSCIVPRHFLSEKEARQWFEEEYLETDNEFPKDVIYEGHSEDGHVRFKLPVKNVKKAFISIKQIIDHDEFHELNKLKFEQLTKREKEILRYLSKAKKHQDIADELNLSIHTIRTHIKNIKLKLQVDQKEDFQYFVQFFS